MPRPHLTTPQRGYGYTHQKTRAAYKPAVDAGQATCTERVCLMASRRIAPGSAWDLAHDRTHPGAYLGPAHAKCNRSEGSAYRRQRAKRARTTPRANPSRHW
jgi:hypothetical protein